MITYTLLIFSIILPYFILKFLGKNLIEQLIKSQAYFVIAFTFGLIYSILLTYSIVSLFGEIYHLDILNMIIIVLSIAAVVSTAYRTREEVLQREKD